VEVHLRLVPVVGKRPGVATSIMARTSFIMFETLGDLSDLLESGSGLLGLWRRDKGP
jgi:hypothetical protein